MPLRSRTGWFRVGVVVSILWVGVVFAYAFKERHDINERLKATGGHEILPGRGLLVDVPMRLVRFREPLPGDSLSPVLRMKDPTGRRVIDTLRIAEAIGLGWLVVWVVIPAAAWNARWVRAGFKK